MAAPCRCRAHGEMGDIWSELQNAGTDGIATMADQLDQVARRWIRVRDRWVELAQRGPVETRAQAAEQAADAEDARRTVLSVKNWLYDAGRSLGLYDLHGLPVLVPVAVLTAGGLAAFIAYQLNAAATHEREIEHIERMAAAAAAAPTPAQAAPYLKAMGQAMERAAAATEPPTPFWVTALKWGVPLGLAAAAAWFFWDDLKALISGRRTRRAA